ncbi:MAG: matrixin family metalloprotease [Planctomycetota bacterium]|nr:MAG: matrixin family metalloprotease [Planctomycetota bacterium]
MRFHSLLLPAAAIGGAVWLLAAPEASAWNPLGGSLGLTQRDVRVFDNFTDTQANDNVTADANFPGYLGIEMASWKAVLEWGSELHGNGNGDPTQAGGLGSGGANFDPSWQGNATGVGTTNQNIMSEETGSSGGVLAYCEAPISDGWRIRFLSTWIWQDGPTAATGNHIDYQGVACHEYGHALGLDHSSTGGATMFPSITGTGSGQRSLATDDINGVQGVYGVKSATKPRITSASATAGVVTINGTNFSATNNEVWFTQKAQGGTGTPIKVTGVASTGGGTQISVTPPGTAGKGDVLVKSGAGGTGAFLSNAWPLDPGVTGGTGPNILSITPSSIDAVTADPLAVTIAGTGFTGTTSVTIAGVTVPVSNYTVNGDSSITILSWPLQNALGDLSIAVTTPGGSDTGLVSVSECDPPVLDMNPSAPFAFVNGTPTTWTVGSEIGDFVYIVASGTPLPSTIPGLIDVGLGNMLSDITVLKIVAIPAKGWAQYSAAPTGLPAGMVIYSAALAFPDETGFNLVEDSDPPQSVLVLF